MMDSRFSNNNFLFRRKIFSLFGSKFYVLGPDGTTVMFFKKKKFRLKEDIRLFTGEDMREELLMIRARSIIDFGATFDVVDTSTGERVGALRRKGFKSMLKDEWIVLDSHDREIGVIKEDSQLMALLRRFLVSLIPQKFEMRVGSGRVALYRQFFNPFIQKMQLTCEAADNVVDRRLVVAAGMLLVLIEGRQDGHFDFDLFGA